MEKLSEILQKYLMPIANKLGNNRYLKSIQEGMMGTMGFTVIGSICLLLATIPFPTVWVDFLGSHPALVEMFFVPYSLTVGIIGVYISFGIGYSLARSYKVNELIGGCSALFSFLVLAGGLSGTLGGEAMFTAILSAIVSVEIYRFCIQKNITIKLPDEVPPAIAAGFSSLIPAALTIILLLTLKYGIGFDVNNIVTTILTPLFRGAQDTIYMALLYVVLATLMWFFGLHPSILVTLMPALALLGIENTAAYAAGEAIPHIFVQPFFFTYVFIGGQCGTLALNLLMLRSKSEAHRQLAKLALPASIFNINEPILFGLPIVLNVTLIIPALIGQIITTFTSWGAFALGIVPMIGLPDAALWNVPAPIAAALSTVSWQAVVLVLVNMLIQGAVYYPFYKVLEKQEIEKSQLIK